MRHHRLPAMLAVLAVLVALPTTGIEAHPAPQKGLESVRFITFNMDAATVAAQARGWFAAEGINLQVTITPNSTEQMRGLGEGTWDIALDRLRQRAGLVGP
jgi:ABC-type nitrate/sulfonate/bicarbonate transport system substrate-binding protein